jgi:tRNA A-37 threonylcarbamoyl transferase component Bud32
VRAASDPHLDTQPEVRAKVRAPRAVDIGTIVGDRYRLVSRLGGGAMGDVFIAENLAIRLRVAVKLLKPELLADAVFRERFQQEAQAIAAIEHPNVARFLDLVVGDPTFLVMEYVRGQTLSEWLREKGPLAMVEAVQVAVRLCWALGAAHAAGIVHRDLKPSNVILTPDLERGHTPKLIDFGLAKLASNVDKNGLTRTGQVVGTPKYMSPEQIAGRPVDQRSDMYSLGCLLYEMLAGRPPFNGEDDVQVLYQQIHDHPPPIRELLPDAPELLEKVLLRALSKDPAQRYGSVAELARSLESSVFTVISGRTASNELYPVGEDQRTLPRHIPTAALPTVRPRRMGAYLLVSLFAIAIGMVSTFTAYKIAGRGAGSAGGFLLVSEPAGANVTLDGKAVGHVTPTWIADVQPGPHTVRFDRSGVAPITQTVTLKAGERAVVQVSLPPATHRLEVRSTPDGASVFLDGRLAFGETPTYVDVTDEDFHELRIVKNGYQTLVKPLTPDDKQNDLNVTLKLETQPRGTLMVDANTAAEVWIDGLNTGYTTPTLGIQVGVGKHLVELRDGNGQKGQSSTILMGQGQTVRLLLGISTGGPPPGPKEPAQ